jgi:hypothetical protein
VTDTGIAALDDLLVHTFAMLRAIAENNLQAHPEARGRRPRLDRGGAARLWERWQALDPGLDGYARRRPARPPWSSSSPGFRS